jgi:D-alanine-D-alanine ligase
MNYPVFVKPVHLGSSIAITRVASHEELANALEVAFHYDNLAIVEEAVQNLIEVTVPIMGNTDDLQVAYVEKPLIAEGSTFDFETKYLKQGGGKKSAKSGAQGYSELPAKLPDGLV